MISEKRKELRKVATKFYDDYIKQRSIKKDGIVFDFTNAGKETICKRLEEIKEFPNLIENIEKGSKPYTQNIKKDRKNFKKGVYILIRRKR